MNTLKINLINPDETVIPYYATSGSAGIDLCAMLDEEVVGLNPDQTMLIKTGIKMAIPQGMVGMIYPRSGIGVKNGLILANGTGVIDSDYRGEVMVAIWNRSKRTQFIHHKDRIAQMVFMPVSRLEIEVVDELDETIRGTGGFGSTGVKA